MLTIFWQTEAKVLGSAVVRSFVDLRGSGFLEQTFILFYLTTTTIASYTSLSIDRNSTALGSSARKNNRFHMYSEVLGVPFFFVPALSCLYGFFCGLCFFYYPCPPLWRGSGVFVFFFSFSVYVSSRKEVSGRNNKSMVQGTRFSAPISIDTR